MKFVIDNLSGLTEVARRLLNDNPDTSVFAFHGDMGAGKTTFIAELCRLLGVEDFANSPTFAIINEYRSSESGELIYHFDCYRLESQEEAFDIGAEDYFESGALCFIEWPQIVEDMLPEGTLDVKITADPETGARTIEW